MRKLIVLGGALLACSLWAQTTAKTSKGWIGTWKLDTAASQFHDNAPKAATLHITAVGKNGTAYTIMETEADGSASHLTYHSTGEGKEAPVMVNGKKTETASYKLADDSTTNGEGEMVDGTKWTMNATLSDDQKTINAKFHYKPAHGGDEFDTTEVFKK